MGNGIATATFKTKVKKYTGRLQTDLLIKGFQADGIWGNCGHESGGFTQFHEIGQLPARGGIGWMQWTGPRRRAFEAWCKSRGLDPRNDEANYLYLVYESSNAEVESLRRLRLTTTRDEAVESWMRNNERPGVLALMSRIAWGKIAESARLEAEDASGGRGEALMAPAAGTVAATPTPTATVAPTRLGWLQKLWGRPVLPPVTPPPAALASATQPPGFDPVLQKVQQELQARGYTEVGVADGLYGDRTRDAISAAQRASNLPVTGHLDAQFLTALVKLPARPVAPERAAATASTLRAAGNPIVQGFDFARMFGRVAVGTGLLGSIDATGALDQLRTTTESVSGAANSVSGVLNTVGSGLGTIATIVQWCTHHWWIFAVLGGLWLTVRAGLGIAEIVIKFRQAFYTSKA